MDSDKHIIRDSSIISVFYCVLLGIFQVSFNSWDEGLTYRIIGCVGIFLFSIMIGALTGGLLGSLLQHRIKYPTSSWEYITILLICNLVSPLIMYLLMKYPVEYLE